MATRIERVGHVVLKVRDLERSARFYRDVLGLREVARLRDRMAFFSAGENHHDIAVLEVGPGAPRPARNGVGLYHVAFRIGTRLEELKAAKAQLEAHGVARPQAFPSFSISFFDSVWQRDRMPFTFRSEA